MAGWAAVDWYLGAELAAAGHTRSNAAIVAVSADRKVAIYNGSGGPTHTTLDTTGYYK